MADWKEQHLEMKSVWHWVEPMAATRALLLVVNLDQQKDVKTVER